MAFDECTPWPAEHDYVKRSLERTTRWLERCIQAHSKPETEALLGIVQGGTYADLRVKASGRSRAFDLPGFALGGLSVGEPAPLLFSMLEETVPLLPANKPLF